MPISRRDAEHIFQKLRDGTVPERGLEAFAVGIDRPRNELRRMLKATQQGEGLSKFLRGGYGCGKTFMSNLALHDAQQLGFVTSFVVVSDNDLHFHKFDELYRKVVDGLSTTACPRGALGDILDRWIGKIEEDLVNIGEDEDAPDFDDKVRAKLDEKLGTLTDGKAPADMVRVVRTIFDLKEQGKLTEANGLLSWLAGSTNVAQSLKKLAQVRGEIASADAMAYLRGILELCKNAGYAGITIVVDEVETLLRSRSDVRQKSLNGIRAIVDDAKKYPGLLWIFTGTPNFFDDRKGVRGLEALDERIRFDAGGGFPSPRQPQLELKPFTAERLQKVALKLRGLYPDASAEELEQKVPDGLIDKLVENVTTGFRGDVGVVPRQFLRQFVNILDQLVEYGDEGYDPAEHVGFKPVALSPQEQRALAGEAADESDFEGSSLEM